MTLLPLLLLNIVYSGVTSTRDAYIVNGKDARIGQFPWQASLQTSSGFHFCGGSLVSDRWVVTAAHCTDGGRQIYVVMGQHDKNTHKLGNPKRYKVEKVIMHENWLPYKRHSTTDTDISVLKLEEAVEMNELVSTIDLPEHNEKFYGECCMISGWGSLYGLNSQSPNILQKLPVRVQSARECQAHGSGSYHTCVFKKGSSACSGDSGGPLACKKNGRWTLVGAASYVYGSCSTYRPTVYSDVPYHREWIRTQTGL